MNVKDIKKTAKQYAKDMMDDGATSADWNPDVDSERSMYRNEYDLDMELANILSGEGVDQ